MNDSILLFFRIKSYYLLLNSKLVKYGVNSKTIRDIELFDEKIFVMIRNESIISSAELKKKINIKGKILSKNYYCYKENKILSFYPVEPSGFLTSKKIDNYIIKINNEMSKQKVMRFRFKTRDNLTKNLWRKNASLANVVEAFSLYTLSDIYTLWVYNPRTDVCTNVVCSLTENRDYVTRDDKTSLFDFIEDNVEYIHRAPNHALDPHGWFKNMNTLNRILLDFDVGDDGTKGILSLYSKFKNFPLVESTKDYIKRYIEQKYFSLVSNRHKELNRVQSVFYERDWVGKMDQLYLELTEKICDKLFFQSCSIFLKSDTEDCLELACSKNYKYHGIPDGREIKYPLSEKTLTTDVYNYNAIGFSYNVNEEDANSHIYDEPTIDPPQNWIGIPITSSETPMGVLRVKNKYRKTENGDFEVTPFRSTDLRRIHAITNNFSAIYYINKIYQKSLRDKKVIEDKYQDLQEFNELFLHELRTPISNFLLMPDMIKNYLKRGQLNRAILNRSLKLLDDISFLGQRLRLIVNIHNVDELIKEKKITKIYVLRDIVMPILNMIQNDLKRRYDQVIKINFGNLETVEVLSDKNLAGTAFNAVIDNAAKYSRDSKKPVTIDGGLDAGGMNFILCISNFGFEIAEDDVERIFIKNYRGELAKRYALAGTGIGLYVTKKIMDEIGGKVIVRNLKDPVTICLCFPLSKLGRI